MSIPVTYKRHIVSNKVDVRYVDGHVSISDIINSTDTGGIGEDYLLVRVGSTTIDREWWDKVFPKSGATVNIYVVPKGNSEFRIIASIAIIIAASYLGGVAGAQYGATTGTLVTAGTSFVGIMAITALFPPSSGSSEDSDSNSNSFNLGLAVNSVRSFQPIRRVLGKRRVVPDIAALPYITREGGEEYLYVIYDFGYGPLKISEVMSGDTLISDYDEVEVIVHEEATDGSELELYTNDTYQTSVDVKLEESVDVIRSASQSGQTLVIDFYIPAMFKVSEDDVDTTEVDLTIHVREEGTSQWIPFNDYPKYHLSGDLSDGKRHLFRMDGSQTEILSRSFRRTYEDLFESTISEGLPAGTTRILLTEVDIDIPKDSVVKVSGNTYRVKNDVSTGHHKVVTLHKPLDADLIFETYKAYGTRAEIKALPQRHSEHILGIVKTRRGRVTIREKKLSPFTCAIRLSKLPKKVYEVKVTRNSANAKGEDRDDVYWRFIRSSSNNSPIDFDDPHTILELRAKATDKLNGSIDRISAIAHSRVQVWSEKDNKFNLKTSRNNAWLALEVLTGSATNRPLDIDGDEYDLQSFIDFANHCDRPDSEGEGYHRFDIDITSAITVKELLRLILGSGRATLSRESGVYSIIIDQNRTVPVQQFSPQNIREFSGSMIFPDIPHALRVEFDDETTDYITQEQIVYNDGRDKKNSDKFETVRLIGISRSDEAWRNARNILAQGVLRPEEFNLKTDIENIICSKGDYVRASHYIPQVGGVSARITEVTGDPASTVTISEPYSIVGSTSIEFRRRDGSVTIVGVSSILDGQIVSLDTAVSGLNVDDICVIGSSQAVSGDYLVKGITFVDEDLSAELTLINLANDLHLADTGDIPEFNPVLSKNNAKSTPDIVQFLQVSLSTVYDSSRKYYKTIYLRWGAPSDTSSSIYSIYEYYNGYKLLDVTDKTYIHITDRHNLSQPFVEGSVFEFVVQARSPAGHARNLNRSARITFTFESDNNAPNNVSNFSGQINGSTLKLTFDPNTDDDILGYTLRWTPFFEHEQPLVWDEAVSIAGSIHPVTEFSVTPRSGTYLVKAYDVDRNQSADAAIYSSTVDQSETLFRKAVVQDGPTWPGESVNLSPISSGLYINRSLQDKYHRYAEYEFNEIIDLGDIYAVILTGELECYAINGSSVGPGSPIHSDAILVFDDQSVSGNNVLLDQYFNSSPLSIESDRVNAHLEVSYVSNHVSMDTWTTLSSVDPIGVGSDQWTEWKKLERAEFTGQKFRFRIVVENNDPENSVYIRFDRILCDVKSRSESGDSTSAVNGSTISFSNDFMEVPRVAISYDSTVSGFRYELTNISTSGFDIEFFDGSTSIARDFNWIAQGYGQKFSQVL